MKHPLFTLMSAMILACVFLQACGSKSPSSDNDWFQVQAQSAPFYLEEIGIFEAKELVKIKTEFRGVISEILEDGTRVDVGDLLLKFDDEELKTDLETETLNLAQFQEDLENEIAEYGVLTNSFNVSTQLKQAELTHAQLELEVTLETLTPENQRLQEIEIELAELTLDEKEKQLARRIELIDKGFAPKSSLQKDLRERDAAQSFLEEKKSQLLIANLPLPAEEKLTLEIAVKNAQDALDRNQARQARDLNILDLKIEGLKLKITQTQRKIAHQKRQLEQISIYAPIAGILRLNHKWTWSNRAWLPISAGQRLYELDMVGTIVDPNDLSLRLIINESDYPFLKVGQKVKARLAAFPDETLSGELIKLTELGQDMDDLSPIYRQSPAIHQALFLAQVHFDHLSEKAIPGMTATAQIGIEDNQNQLLIPLNAVSEVQDHYQVIRKRNGKTETITIEGRITASGFEVSKGLQVGDLVKANGGES